MSSIAEDAVAESKVSTVVAAPLVRLATVTLSFIASAGLDLFLPPTVSLFSPLDLVAVGLGAWAFGRRTAIAIATLLTGLAAASAAAVLSPSTLAAVVLSRWVTGIAVAELVVRVTAAIASLRAAAERDPLTGLFNRRGFATQAAIELGRARRGQRPICLATFDLDDFKRVNDELGHAEGDRLLVALGRVLQRGRVGDVAGRLGGDEFALLMPETTPEAAQVALARMRGSGILALSCDDRCVTFTTGVAAFQRAPARMGELLEAADAALIAAKRLRHTVPAAASRPALESLFGGTLKTGAPRATGL
jgi:diguanylate cyclase (GGDEF)-like protein